MTEKSDESRISEKSLLGQVMHVPRIGERADELELELESVLIGDAVEFGRRHRVGTSGRGEARCAVRGLERARGSRYDGTRADERRARCIFLLHRPSSIDASIRSPVHGLIAAGERSVKILARASSAATRLSAARAICSRRSTSPSI